MFHPNEFPTQSRFWETARSAFVSCLDRLSRWQVVNRAKSAILLRLSFYNLEHELRSVTAELNQSKEQLLKVNIEQQKLRSALLNARDLQETLLPHSKPIVVGLDVFAASKPAHEVNGDFYDFINPDLSCLTFTIGDVSGKGVPAALLMTMTRKVLRTGHKLLEDPSPCLVLDYSNRDLYEEFSRTGMFATTFIGQFASESRLLQYANAGHSPVIYRTFNGHARAIQADDLPIGVFVENDSQEHQIRLLPGDIFVVGTDGITDARDESGEMFGQERLLRIIDANAEKSATEITSIIFQAVAAFEGERSQDDDQTLVVLKGI